MVVMTGYGQFAKALCSSNFILGLVVRVRFRQMSWRTVWVSSCRDSYEAAREKAATFS